jgi:nucleoside-diphosphate-sugar epimerase
MNKQKILVTGASGFVGGEIHNNFLNNGYDVTGLSGPSHNDNSSLHKFCLNKIDSESTFFKNVDILIHCAAKVHQNDMDDMDSSFDGTNAKATLDLLLSAKKNNIKNFIYISSTSVYGCESSINILDKNSVVSPQTKYSKSKLKAENFVSSFCIENNINYLILRCPLIYGRHAPGNFKSLEFFAKSKIPIINSSIHSVRSFLYVKNLSDFILFSVENSIKNSLYLLSDLDDINVSYFILKIRKKIRPDAKISTIKISRFILYFIFTLINKKKIFSNIFCDFQVDKENVLKECSWTPPYDLNDALDEIHFI